MSPPVLCLSHSLATSGPAGISRASASCWRISASTIGRVLTSPKIWAGAMGLPPISWTSSAMNRLARLRSAAIMPTSELRTGRP